LPQSLSLAIFIPNSTGVILPAIKCPAISFYTDPTCFVSATKVFHNKKNKALVFLFFYRENRKWTCGGICLFNGGVDLICDGSRKANTGKITTCSSLKSSIPIRCIQNIWALWNEVKLRFYGMIQKTIDNQNLRNQ
jgi:hypothetical protein